MTVEYETKSIEYMMAGVESYGGELAVIDPWPEQCSNFAATILPVPEKNKMLVVTSRNRFLNMCIHGIDETGFYIVAHEIGHLIDYRNQGFPGKLKQKHKYLHEHNNIMQITLGMADELRADRLAYMLCKRENMPERHIEIQYSHNLSGYAKAYKLDPDPWIEGVKINNLCADLSYKMQQISETWYTRARSWIPQALRKCDWKFGPYSNGKTTTPDILTIIPQNENNG
jgi:hypothetical protein